MPAVAMSSPASCAGNSSPAGVISTFTSTYATSPLNVGTAGSATSGMNTGTSRYFIVSIQLPTTITDQTIQGRAATFAFSWQLAQ